MVGLGGCRLGLFFWLDGSSVWILVGDLEGSADGGLELVVFAIVRFDSRLMAWADQPIGD